MKHREGKRPFNSTGPRRSRRPLAPSAFWTLFRRCPQIISAYRAEPKPSALGAAPHAHLAPNPVERKQGCYRHHSPVRSSPCTAGPFPSRVSLSDVAEAEVAPVKSRRRQLPNRRMVPNRAAYRLQSLRLPWGDFRLVRPHGDDSVYRTDRTIAGAPTVGCACQSEVLERIMHEIASCPRDGEEDAGDAGGEGCGWQQLRSDSHRATPGARDTNFSLEVHQWTGKRGHCRPVSYLRARGGVCCRAGTDGEHVCSLAAARCCAGGEVEWS
jgi:hypothetical protein